jgi:hypothetical protein
MLDSGDAGNPNRRRIRTIKNSSTNRSFAFGPLVSFTLSIPKSTKDSYKALLVVLKTNVPACFQTFSDTRIILDCTEIFVQTPSSLENQSQTYSNYKSHNTFKALVGILLVHSTSSFVNWSLVLKGGQ